MIVPRRGLSRFSRSIVVAMAATIALGLLVSSAMGTLVLPAPEFDTDYQRPEMAMPLADGNARDAIYVAVLLAALVVAIYLVHRRRSRRAVVALSIVSLALLGFWLMGCICPIGAVQNVSRSIIDPSYILPWAAVAVLIAPLVVALLYGRVFCGGVCPLGAIQDVVLLRPLRVPDWLDKPLALLPFAYLGLALVTATTGGPFIICQYDPFVGLFRMGGEMWIIGTGLALLALGTIVARPYCRFLCPYGVLLGFCSSVTRKRMSTSPSDCINCRLCEKACPVGAIRPPTEEPGDPVEHRPHRIAWLLPLVPLVLAAGGWLAGPAVARMHPTIELWRLVEEDLRTQADERPDEVEAFYASPGNTVEALEVEAQMLYGQFRLGTMLAAAFVGLGIAVQGAVQLRRPVRYAFEVNQRTCLACARCVEYCPLEHRRRKSPAETEQAAAARLDQPDKPAAREEAVSRR